MIYRSFVIPILFFFIFMQSASTIAQGEKQLTLKELCNISSDIIIGKVIDKQSYRSLDGKHVYTDVKIKIEEIIHGKFNKEETIIMKVYGGTIDGKTVYVVGAPNYYIGTSSLFFLAKWKSENTNSMLIVGNSQGKFDISEEKNGVKKIERNDYNPFIYEEKLGNYIDFDSRVTQLEDFKTKIKKYL